MRFLSKAKYARADMWAISDWTFSSERFPVEVLDQCAPFFFRCSFLVKGKNTGSRGSGASFMIAVEDV